MSIESENSVNSSELENDVVSENNEFDFSYLENESEEDTDLNDEEDESEDEEEVAQSPKKSGFKKRIDKLNKRNSDLENELHKLKEMVMKNHSPKEEETKDNKETSNKETELKKPVFSDFDDYDEYVEAMFDYKSALKDKESSEKSKVSKVKEQEDAVHKTYEENVKKAQEKYKDFNKALENLADVPMFDNNTLVAIKTSSVGPDMVYYLAKNKDFAKDLAKKSTVEQLKTIGRLEEKLETKVKVSSTKQKETHEPINPIKVQSGTKSNERGSIVYNQNMSFKEYQAWRAKSKK